MVRLCEVSVDRHTEPARLYLLLAALLSAIAIGGVVDLAFDNPDTIFSFHVLFEVTIMLLSLGTASYLWRAWHGARQSLEFASATLERHLKERDLWRARARKLVVGLGEEIDRQLRDWGLTPAERQAAVLLLKGLSHKEIARLTGKSERTARQHSIAVYRKSGLSGRAELSAFFLEDLLAPGLEGKGGATDTVPTTSVVHGEL